MIAQSRALAFSRFAATPLYLIFKLLHPFARWFAGLSTQLNNRMRPISSGLSSDDLNYLADVGIQHGTLQEEEHGMIHSIAEFGETTVREIMVSRMDMIAIADTASLSDVFNVVREYSYSRYPVYQESLDDIIGLIYAKDLLPLIEKEATNPDTPWLNLCRTHVAIVTDENSGTEGLVTMEDILEEIVGEIHDETDDDEENQFIHKMDANTYIINARINLDDLSEALNLSLEWEEDSFDTLAGLILHINEDIPKKGEVILYENLKMTVQSLENHRIEKVLMEILV
jgi:CBS domain containing-hemolysin-like protein